MALSVRSSSQNSSSTGTALSFSAPTGTTTGDFCVGIICVNTQTTITDNNGSTVFTVAPNFNNYKPNPTNGMTVSVFSRTILAGDPSTYNFTSGANDRWGGVFVTLTDSSSPSFDVTPNTTNATNTDDSASGTIVNPTITTGVDNAIHITFGAWDTSAIGTITIPGGYTLANNANGGGQPVSVSYKTITPAGATGTTTISNTQFGARIGGSFSIKGAAAGGIIVKATGFMTTNTGFWGT